MTVYMDNPAGRLHALIERARGLSNQPAWNTWASAFDISPNNSMDQFACIARVVRMIEAVPRLMHQLMEATSAQIYLEGFHGVESIIERFKSISQYNAENFFAEVGGTAMKCLKVCALQLHEKLPEVSPEGDAIAELIGKVDQLVDEFEKLDWLSEVDKDWILKALRKIQSRLSRSQLFGTADVVEVADEFVHRMHRTGIWSRLGRDADSPGGRLALFLATVFTTLTITGWPALPPAQNYNPSYPMTVEIDELQELTVDSDPFLIGPAGDQGATANDSDEVVPGE
ncbi:hypothetical protein [Actinokineospora xionganensis]|uniref:Uncharacterized protein n=1 Tax=Actinokineospora xionganensis TaxID=2684470 RepID=A0ABR7LG77_9PSEU|nr:hypothetical protein [Actinokineospora xionganensis]MBC6451721.1 hypothetical protein [Actinokineospora xionganensis]